MQSHFVVLSDGSEYAFGDAQSELVERLVILQRAALHASDDLKPEVFAEISKVLTDATDMLTSLVVDQPAMLDSEDQDMVSTHGKWQIWKVANIGYMLCSMDDVADLPPNAEYEMGIEGVSYADAMEVFTYYVDLQERNSALNN
jgi:hypothetical protein